MNYSLTFYLNRATDEVKSKEERTIYYYITWKGDRLRKSTNKKCRQCDWIDQRVSNKLEYSHKVNPTLSDIEYKIEKFFEGLRYTPTQKEVLSIISDSNTSKEGVIPCFESFIAKSKSGERKTKKGRKVKGKTIAKYEYALSILKSFQDKKSYSLRWERINDTFYHSFTEYMWVDLEFYDNSVGTVINPLKTFLNWCVDEKIIKDKIYNNSWITWKEDIDILVLYPDELKILFNADIPQEHKATAHLFLAGCMTCLRVSNLNELDKDKHIVGDQLKIVTAKTYKSIMLDISPMLKDIFSQYENLLPKRSVFYFNKKLKSLAKWLKEEIAKGDKKNFVGNAWDSKFIRTRYKRGEGIQISCNIEDMISSHTMRRTGITNLLMMGLSETEVKGISGHSFSGESFAKYVKIAEQFLSKKSNDAWAKIAK
jgi:site-specific recombinase XerD